MPVMQEIPAVWQASAFIEAAPFVGTLRVRGNRNHPAAHVDETEKSVHIRDDRSFPKADTGFSDG